MRFLEGHQGPVRCLAYSPDGSTLASGDDQTVWLWDVMAGQVRAAGAERADRITALAFRPDGASLASGTGDGSIQIRDSSTAKVFAPFRLSDQLGQLDRAHRNPVNALGFVAAGRAVLSIGGGSMPGIADYNGSGNQVRLWFPDSGHNVQLSGFEQMWGFGADVAGYRLFFGTGTRFLSTCRLGGKGLEACAEGRVPFPRGGVIHHSRVVESRPRNFPRAQPKAAAQARPLAVSPDGRFVAAPWNHVVEIWDATEFRLRATCEVTASSLAFRPDGQILASSSLDGSVRLWDSRDGRPLERYDWGIGPVHCLAFAPDGMTIAAGGGSGLVVWDVDEPGC